MTLCELIITSVKFQLNLENVLLLMNSLSEHYYMYSKIYNHLWTIGSETDDPIKKSISSPPDGLVSSMVIIIIIFDLIG